MANLNNGEAGKEKNKALDVLTIRGMADQSISAHDYPSLGLEKDEYVVIDIERTRIGIVIIWVYIIVISFLAMIFCHTMLQMTDNLGTVVLIVALGYVAVITSVLFGLADIKVYQRNYMIVSNKRVFTRSQIGPFAAKTQVIELENIEDVGVSQSGIISSFLNCGEIRLSTELDESAYKLSYVSDPNKKAIEIKKVMNNIESKKS